MAAKITAFGSNCIISVPFDGDNYNLLIGLPGFKKFKDGSRDLIFRPTTNNIRYINQHWPDADWDSSVKSYLTDFINEQLEAASTSKDKWKELEDDKTYEYKTKPFDHQRNLFMLSRDKKSFAFFMEQGTGKSKPVIDTAAWQYSQGLIDALVVIAPNGVHRNWIEEEIPKHLPDWCPREMWTYSAHLLKAEKLAFEELVKKTGVLKIFAFNVEGFVSDKAQSRLEKILTYCKPLIATDESQYIKNPSAGRTDYLTKACSDVQYKRILTGTSVTKGVEDLYGQFTWLNEKILGFDSKYTFRNHFCTMGGFEMRKVVGYKNLDELIKLIDPYSYRVTKAQCLDLPPKIYKRWVVELTKQQREIYDKVSNDFYAELNGRTLTANLAIVRLLRLQQITCGWFPSQDANGKTTLEPIPGENPKLEAVLQHCRDIDGQVIVWAGGAGNTQDIKNITEELKREHGRDSCAAYYGKTDQEDRTEIRQEFQAGNLKYIVANGSAARGLTLTKCENPIYFSNSYDLEFRLQSEDRTHRIGTINSVTYTDVEAKKTRDRRIINALKSKKNIADIINQDPKSLFMEESD